MPRARSRLYRDPKSPYWYAVWTDPQGQHHRQSTRCRDHGAAAIWLAARELERVSAAAGIPFARPATLDLATAEYVAEREPTWSKGWRDVVEGFFRHRVLPHFGAERLVSAVTRADVERFRSQEVGRPRERGGGSVSDATVNRMMAALAAFGRWCLVEGRQYHTSNPWGGHEPLPEDELPVPDLEEHQVQRLLAALDPPAGKLPAQGRRRYRYPWRALVEFARETGLRKGELARLRREDRRRDVLYVVSTRRRGRTKGRKMRSVPLSRRARAILDALPRRADGLLFGPVGDPRAAFRTAARAAGLERVWTHLFRHLWASRLSERGAGRHELRELGGWTSSRVPDRYLHARMERLRALVEGGEQRRGGGAEAGGGPEPAQNGPQEDDPDGPR